MYRAPKSGKESGGDCGVVVRRSVAVEVEGGLDDLRGNGAFAAYAPEVSTKFDDGGGNEALSLASVEDEGNTIAELAEDFVATGAGGRAGDVGAGAGERDANFRDESSHDFTSGPPKSDAASVAGNLERKAHGSVEDDGEGPRPECVGKTVEIVGKLASENVGVVDGVDENGKSLRFGAALDAEDFVDSREVDGVGGERVERVGGDGDDRAAIEPTSSVTDEARIGRIRAKL